MSIYDDREETMKDRVRIRRDLDPWYLKRLVPEGTPTKPGFVGNSWVGPYWVGLLVRFFNQETGSVETVSLLQVHNPGPAIGSVANKWHYSPHEPPTNTFAHIRRADGTVVNVMATLVVALRDGRYVLDLVDQDT